MTLSARQLSFVSQTVITASWFSSSVRRYSEVVGFDRVCMDSRTIHALLPALWYSASKAGFTCQSYQFQYRPPASHSTLAVGYISKCHPLATAAHLLSINAKIPRGHRCDYSAKPAVRFAFFGPDWTEISSRSGSIGILETKQAYLAGLRARGAPASKAGASESTCLVSRRSAHRFVPDSKATAARKRFKSSRLAPNPRETLKG